MFRDKRTEDWEELAYDVMNRSEEALEFEDFSGRKRPKIVIPPHHIACIPDNGYRGRTVSGRSTPPGTVFQLYGTQRPLRRVVRGVAFYDSGVYPLERP